MVDDKPSPLPHITPFQFLFASSLPFGIGAFAGYKRAVKKYNAEISSNSPSSCPSLGGNSVARNGVPHIPPPVLAARALAIGSLVSIAGVGMLTAGVFYSTGADSVDEFVEICESRLRAKGLAFERWSGTLFVGEDEVKKKQEERQLELSKVKTLSEEEEIDYWDNKYFGGVPKDDEKKEA